MYMTHKYIYIYTCIHIRYVSVYIYICAAGSAYSVAPPTPKALIIVKGALLVYRGPYLIL